MKLGGHVHAIATGFHLLLSLTVKLPVVAGGLLRFRATCPCDPARVHASFCLEFVDKLPSDDTKQSPLNNICFPSPPNQTHCPVPVAMPLPSRSLHRTKLAAAAMHAPHPLLMPGFLGG